MAALTATELTERLPLGNVSVKTFRTTTGSLAAAADEWIDTGLSEVLAIVGHAVHGIAGATINFVKNAQGTGQAEGSTLGALGIESSAASTVVEVTVLGRP